MTTGGSQKFQFNRLLKAVDELVASGEVKDTVFAQIGYKKEGWKEFGVKMSCGDIFYYKSKHTDPYLQAFLKNYTKTLAWMGIR